MSATEGSTTFCRRCGAPIGSGVAFCGRCGLRVAAPLAPPVPSPPPQNYAPAPAPAPPPPPQSYAPAPPPQEYAPAPPPQPYAPPAQGYAPPGGQPVPSGYAPQPGYPTPPGANPYPAPGAGGDPAAAPVGYGQAPAGYGAAPAGYGAPAGTLSPAAMTPAAKSLGRRGRIPAVVKFGVLALVLVVVGSGILRAVQGSSLSSGPKDCVYSCAPDTGAVQPVANTFHSSDGFSFAYPGGWKQTSAVKGFLANFSGSEGEFLVNGGGGTPSLSSVLDQAVQRVSSDFQDFKTVGSLPGSRLGDQSGAGAIYSANAQTSSGQQFPVRIVIITAEQGGHWASFTAIGQLNPNATPSGVNGGSYFDDVITQWTWS